MPSRKRNLEKVEQRVANAPAMDTHAEARGEAAKYLRDLIAKAERGELKGELKGKPATEEKRPETWLEAEVKTIAERLRHRARSEGARPMVRQAHADAKATGADDEPTDKILARLLRKAGLASDKVH